MTQKALISKRNVSRSEAISASEGAEAENLGLKVEHYLPNGTLVKGDEKKFAMLEARGYRVKLLPNTNILQVGAYKINIEAAPPKVPENLEVPKTLEKTWRHHLVQLAGPLTESWAAAIKEQGVDIVEPISAYGLFVIGNPEAVNKLKNLPFVAWVGPFKPAYRLHPNLSEFRGKIKYVNIGIYPKEEVASVKEVLVKVGANLIRESTPSEDHQAKYAELIVEVDASKLPTLACLPSVRWLEYASPTPGYDGERETQIVAENLNGGAAPNTAPLPGYQAWLASIGLGGGAGVTLSICDGGVDANANNNTTGHLDLRGRQTAFVNYTGNANITDTDGHGTHVAGIAVGNAATNQTEAAAPNNFLWGQGMAPQANYVTQNATVGPWPPANFGTFTQDAVNNGAVIMNNSWWDGGPAGSGYTANARRFDQLVRDPNDATAALEHLVIVSSAGNVGPNASTITPPKEAKNLITVGNSLTFRPGVGATDDIRGIAGTSSRGPARDGRILPNVVAPGTDVSSTFSRTSGRVPIAGTGTPDPAHPATMLNQYLYLSGTSMASPHVTGCCALLTEWWRNRTNAKNPSPALLKALLINGAIDLVGGPSGRTNPTTGAQIPLTNIPNNDQGWGRVSLQNILLQAPASDRGPKIFFDQRHAFTASGQQHLIRLAPVDTARPIRITLVWTDAPGAEGSNPALVNDLDLEVTEVATGNIYRGNVFGNGFSTTGGAFDSINNIECVYLQNPSGIYEVRVIAANIADSARPDITTPWQDFALVIDNAEYAASVPVSVVPVIDRSGSMIFFGYENITRISSKQFVDLMGVDDKIGVVSFGSTGDVEYPTGAVPSLQTITGQPIRNAAKAEIDGMAFGGCTFMGEGIIKARDLLNPATEARAMVLLSDGYDNKGCQPTNPARPSATDAVATLPTTPPTPVYTCAMGPASDQNLLELIANSTGGRYYYMPTIDELFEIYNYIRGQVTSTSIIVNESATASFSRIGAFVDALATEATFTVSWADTNLKFVLGNPEKANDINIRLRDPKGRLLHASSSQIRRTVGEGYVAFNLQDPMPGQWYVEANTAGNTHVRYTVGGFVKSTLRLLVSLLPKQVLAGMPVTIATQVFDGNSLIKGFRSRALVTAPSLSIAGLLTKYKTQIRTIRSAGVAGDTLPTDIAKLVTLRKRMLNDKVDIFASAATVVPLKDVTIGDVAKSELKHLIPPGVILVGHGEAITETPALGLARLAITQPTAISGIATEQFKNTKQQGTYNVIVTATGSSPVSNTRFVRKELVSVRVK